MRVRLVQTMSLSNVHVYLSCMKKVFWEKEMSVKSTSITSAVFFWGMDFDIMFRSVNRVGHLSICMLASLINISYDV